jgi:hypothetical protein
LNILVQHPGRQFKAIEGRRTPFTTPPGPNFDIKKLGAGDVHEIAGSYVDNILNDNDTDNYQAFSVVRWSASVWYLLPSQ